MKSTSRLRITALMFIIVLWVALIAASLPAAIPPSPVDAVFEAGDQQDVIDAMTSSAAFKTAVAEAIKARDERATEIKAKPKSIGISPAQAARVRFIEVLQGKQ